MSMTVTQWLFALAGVVGPAFLLWVMHRRNLRRQFPFFFNYLILYAMSCCIGIAAFLYNCTAYFFAYWTLSVLLMVVEFGVIYEILINTLKSYSALIDLAKVLFRWAAVFLLLMTLITALATNGSRLSRLEAAINVVDHSLRLMQCGLLLFLLVFETRLGLSWRNYGMSIAMGMGLYAVLDVTTSYLKMLALVPTNLLDIVGGTFYIGLLVFWGCVLMLPEPERKSMSDSPKRLIFQRWNEALMATPLVTRNNQAALPVESFLPGVERAVERVMSRKMAN